MAGTEGKNNSLTTGEGIQKQPRKKSNSVSREFAGVQASDSKPSEKPGDSANINFILDIPLKISVELGRTEMLVNELLKLGQGSVISLSKSAGEHLEVFANQKLIARGEVVVVDDKYGIRLAEIVSHTERIERLK
jgi:flagellar motor switch protein FliN/FliY